VIAYDDDSFQDTDSSIIDLTLPTTGTYYAMVTSSPKSSALGEPLTGNYELFMYTFATGGDPPAGDTLYAGSGDDTLVGGAGDDTISARLPQDTIIYGSGTVQLLSSAPYLDVSAGSNQTVNEGTFVTLTGSYIDPTMPTRTPTTGTSARRADSRSPTGPACRSRSARQRGNLHGDLYRERFRRRDGVGLRGDHVR